MTDPDVKKRGEKDKGKRAFSCDKLGFWVMSPEITYF